MSSTQEYGPISSHDLNMLLSLFGVQKREPVPSRRPLPRYAIQGLPGFGR